MVKHCCVVDCTADSRKYAKLWKYPWMSELTFLTFPFASQASIYDQNGSWLWGERVKHPTKTPIYVQDTSLVAFQFLKKPIPTLFLYNNYRESDNPKRPLPVRRAVMAETPTLSIPNVLEDHEFVMLYHCDALDIGSKVIINEEPPVKRINGG